MSVTFPMTVRDFWGRAAVLAMLYPYSVHGGGRTTKYNENVGGVKDSWHIMWLALDGILDDPKQGTALRDRAARMGMQVILKKDGNFHMETMG